MYKLDPYLSVNRCYRRLHADYNQHKSLIIAVDFDNTIYDYHQKGRQFPQVLDLLKRCNALGFKLVIFTANKDKQLIWTTCTDLEIEITGINENVLTGFSSSDKIYYNILLDDRAGLKQSYDTLLKLVTSIEEENKTK